MSVEFQREVQLPVITTNFEAVKAELTAELAKYNKLVVTEDSYQFCKARVKDLSGMKNVIKEGRISVKNEVMKPYDEFKAMCDELDALVDSVQIPLKEGVEFYDEQRRQEKLKTAEGIIAEEVAKSGLRPAFASRVEMKKEYGNLGATSTEVTRSVQAQIFALQAEQRAEDDVIEILTSAIANHNNSLRTPMTIDSYLKYIGKMGSAQILNLINEEAARLYKAENPDPIPEPQVSEVPTPDTAPETRPAAPVAPPRPTSAGSTADILMWMDIHVSGTKTQALAVIDFMKSNGIKYEVTAKDVIK